MGNLSENMNLDPVGRPKQYGFLVTANTAIPDFLAAPFFLIAGFYLRAIKRQKLVTGEIDKVKLEENR
jgi:TRAP-type mannitol/chloroaromatic compound transport system permease large subunit